MPRTVRKQRRIGAARSLPRRRVLAALVAGALLIVAPAAHAATPEQQCQKARYDAKAKYNGCQEKAVAKFYGGTPLTLLIVALDRAHYQCRASLT